MIRWAALGVAYLLMAGKLGMQEGAVALVGGGAAAWFSFALRRGVSRHFAFSGLPLGPLLRLAGALVRETASVGGVLFRAVLPGGRAIAGTVADQPFERGGEAPSEAARRGLVELGLSLSPNGYVLDEAAPGALILHRLAPQPASADRRWPL